MQFGSEGAVGECVSSSDVACRSRICNSAASLFQFAVENTRKLFGPAVDVAPVILLVLAPFQRLDATKAALTLTMTLMVIALAYGPLRLTSRRPDAMMVSGRVGRVSRALLLLERALSKRDCIRWALRPLAARCTGKLGTSKRRVPTCAQGCDGAVTPSSRDRSDQQSPEHRSGK